MSLSTVMPSAPAAPQGRSGPLNASARTLLPQGLTAGMFGALGGAHASGAIQGQRRLMNTAQRNEEREACEKASREIRGLRVLKNDVYKITEDSRVLDDIVVAADAILVIENARLFFAEDAGIVSLGTLRAKNSTFTAADPVRRWKNCAIHPATARSNIIEGCTFRYGRGRTWPRAVRRGRCRSAT